jgi:hypothetical protein
MPKLKAKLDQAIQWLTEVYEKIALLWRNLRAQFSGDSVEELPEDAVTEYDRNFYQVPRTVEEVVRKYEGQ